MRALTPRFLLPPLLALALAAAGVALGHAWWGLIVAALVGLGVALWLALHVRTRLLAIQALVVSGLVRPGSERPDDELTELEAAVERFAQATATQHRGDLEELEHQTFLLDRMNDGLLRVAADGRIRYANVAAGMLFGGRNPTGHSFLRVTLDHELRAALTRCLETGQDQEHTLELPEQGRLISAVIARVVDDPPEALVMLRDITEVNRLQSLRRDFVANVSHELRTPLATIKILAETLLDLRADDPDAVRYLTQLDGEIDVMSALVRDLLDLSSLEAQPRALTLAPTDAARIVRDTRERMSALAERADVRLDVELDADELPLTADERRLRQALVNLVSNAIAYTPAGGRVTLGARADARTVTFWVRDTGRGIAPEDLDRVWERFYKADRARAGGGAGLGLAIVKHIVLAHGGSVSASSELGTGSEFRFGVPRR